VQSLLQTLGDQTEPSLVAHVRRECSSLSASSTAVLMEVLSTGLATSPRAARLFLLSIRGSAPSQLSLVDVLVQVLLFALPQHQAAAQEALVRQLASPGAATLPLLRRLADLTAEAHWAPLGPALADVAQWLFVCPATLPRSRLVTVLLAGAGAGQGTEAAAPTRAAARLLRRLFELHAHLRDQILGFLKMLCVPPSVGLYRADREAEGEGPAGQQQRRLQQQLLPLMLAAAEVVVGLARRRPELLVRYSGGSFTWWLTQARPSLPARLWGGKKAYEDCCV
jgi:hypothetical protein